ncbi:TRAP transporter small permease [Alloiococcus sp. CFN-8]|uniref:TRAP transporter small permease n=1 Tax=Alloiococcus sp. CFN-8 TaxID=3416081 RepID=UPI003CE99732
MKKYLQYLQKIEDAIMILAFIIMVLTSFAQVVNRNFVHAGVSWFEELARYCMVYMALLGAEAGLRDGTQLSIVAFTNKFKGIAKQCILIIAKLITVVFSAIILVTSFELVMNQVNNGQMTPGLGIPMCVPYFALPFAFSIIVAVQGFSLIVMIIDLFKPRKEGEV